MGYACALLVLRVKKKQTFYYTYNYPPTGINRKASACSPIVSNSQIVMLLAIDTGNYRVTMTTTNHVTLQTGIVTEMFTKDVWIQ